MTWNQDDQGAGQTADQTADAQQQPDMWQRARGAIHVSRADEQLWDRECQRLDVVPEFDEWDRAWLRREGIRA